MPWKPCTHLKPGKFVTLHVHKGVPCCNEVGFGPWIVLHAGTNRIQVASRDVDEVCFWVLPEVVVEHDPDLIW